MIKYVLTKDYSDMSRKAANILSAQILLKPDSVLGLATGSSPLGIYTCLAERCKKGDLDFSRITCVNLDEFRGVARESEHSYYRFMLYNLFSRINIDINRTFIPDGSIENADEACEEYERILTSVG